MCAPVFLQEPRPTCGLIKKQQEKNISIKKQNSPCCKIHSTSVFSATAVFERGIFSWGTQHRLKTQITQKIVVLVQKHSGNVHTALQVAQMTTYSTLMFQGHTKNALKMHPNFNTVMS